MKKFNKFKTFSKVINITDSLITELKHHLEGYEETEIVLTYYHMDADRWVMYLARHYDLGPYVHFYIDNIKCYITRRHLNSIEEDTALVKDGIVSKFIKTDIPFRSFEIIDEEA